MHGPSCVTACGCLCEGILGSVLSGCVMLHVSLLHRAIVRECRVPGPCPCAPEWLEYHMDGYLRAESLAG